MLLLNQNESHVHLSSPIRDLYLSFNQDDDICWVPALVFTGWKRNPFFRIMPKSLAVSTCFNFLEWTCRFSFEDSCEHQETLWSSKDWTHFESRNNNSVISLVSSPLFISFLCHSAMVIGCYLSSDLNKVLVLMNLSHCNGFNFAILEVGNQGPSSLHQVWLFNLFCFSEKGKDTTGQICQPRIWNHAHPVKVSRETTAKTCKAGRPLNKDTLLSKLP